MGIEIKVEGFEVEINTALVLKEWMPVGRREKECAPEKPRENMAYDFLKRGQRSYPLGREIDLVTRDKGGRTTRIGKVTIIETTHYRIGETNYTRGKYRIERLGK